MDHNETAPFSWKTFLRQISQDLIQDPNLAGMLPAEVVKEQWLGYPAAESAEIDALEQRLGKRLPPSYRSFLAESNGWRNSGAFIYDLWPCAKVAWFRERNQEWIDAYLHPEPFSEEPLPKLAPLSDEDYFVYDERQDAGLFRDEHLAGALEISDVGDSAILLLNPSVVSESGEWEAWFFANWIAGANRYRSFQELMQDHHETFLKFLAEKI